MLQQSSDRDRKLRINVHLYMLVHGQGSKD